MNIDITTLAVYGLVMVLVGLALGIAAAHEIGSPVATQHPERLGITRPSWQVALLMAAVKFIELVERHGPPVPVESHTEHEPSEQPKSLAVKLVRRGQ